MAYYEIKMKDGMPYMPSNGSEGMWFCSEFCDNCIHQHPDPSKQPQCDEILLESLIGNQPPEWIYMNNEPTCTAFRRWDWGNDDGWNEPPAPEPEDPNQLLIPFSITELFLFNDQDIVVTKKAIFEITT